MLIPPPPPTCLAPSPASRVPARRPPRPPTHTDRPIRSRLGGPFGTALRTSVWAVGIEGAEGEGRQHLVESSLVETGSSWRKTRSLAKLSIGEVGQAHLRMPAKSGLADIPPTAYIPGMEWEVEYTNEFGQWWRQLDSRQQEDIAAIVELLQERGASLPFPYSSNIASSRHGVMRELRVQSGGRPVRVLYAFDPRRAAILLIGATRREVTDSTRRTSQRLTLYTTSTWPN